MMPGIEFICGCQTKDIVTRENIKTMDMITFDDEGFLICSIHRQRRKGWRSIPTHDGSSNICFRGEFFGHDPLHVEGALIFGEELPQKTVKI